MSFDDTRKPVSGLAIGFGLDNSCGERIGPDATRRTDRHGVATLRITVNGPFVACAWAPFPGSTRAFPGGTDYGPSTSRTFTITGT
jgi:hypothetical protein